MFQQISRISFWVLMEQYLTLLLNVSNPTRGRHPPTRTVHLLVWRALLSALGIAFPALIELCLFWPDKFGYCRWILFKDILIILCGIFGLVIGTYTSLLVPLNKINYTMPTHHLFKI
uniref:Uncharacterized protein n=1 Tax=Timema monikensis TaxID=170555 RepID=A0A7R9EAA7_9NEOP|nr:unnamed protein product [Timema monikensis]